jgi:hypothetical protein
MCENSSSPTHDAAQSLHVRCPHGYYLDAKQIGTPRCRSCDPMSQHLEPEYVSYSLALLAFRNSAERPRTDKGKFVGTSTVEPGKCRCWRCGEVFPLNNEHFARQTTKKCAAPNGFVKRCKKCDNRMRYLRRYGHHRPGVQALLDVGVRL